MNPRNSISVGAVVALALTIATGFVAVDMQTAEAHCKQVSQKDFCHNSADTGLHWHPEEENCDLEALCVRNKNWSIKYLPTVVETVREVEVVREIKDVNVREFESAMSDVISRISRQLDRPPKVVEVEKRVPWLRPTTAHCEELRDEFESRRLRGFKKLGNQAINDGCW